MQPTERFERWSCMEAVSSQLTGGPFGSEPTFSLRRGPPSLEPVTEAWGSGEAVVSRSCAFEKPIAEPAPRVRAIAVIAVLAMTTATVASCLLRALFF